MFLFYSQRVQVLDYGIFRECREVMKGVAPSCEALQIKDAFRGG